MQTRVAQLETGLADAVALLHAGQVVAFATETVYGLGADARQPEAITRIYTAKGRPSYNPLIVHVAAPAEARGYMATVPAFAPELMAAFWPGPLTLVVPRGGALAPSVSAGLSTVALRCPEHPLAQALLRAFAGPIAAPSANRSGFVSPTTAAHVLAELDGRIPLILDGGASAIGLESTVVDLTTSPPTLLRPGGITAEQIRAITGQLIVPDTYTPPIEDLRSPGLLARHYAPRKPAWRFTTADWPSVQACLKTCTQPVTLITDALALHLDAPHETLLMPASAMEYAAHLYDAVHRADAQSGAEIWVHMPDEHNGVWLAIHDRWQRATQPWTLREDRP